MNQAADATEYLAERGIPASAREFRIRQEFYRIKWDMRVREEGGRWLVVAAKADRPRVEVDGANEAEALRLGLAAAIRFDEAAT